MNDHRVEIRFYLKRNPYGCFSNFAGYPVEIDGRLWKTTEHYYQAQKFAGTEYEGIIADIEAPFRAKMMAKKEGLPKRKDWYDVKFGVMMVAVTAKFTQYEVLRGILVSTGNAVLTEHTELDSYWGDGGDGTGRSRLGEALMKVRSSFPEYDGMFFEPPWRAFPGHGPDDDFWKEGDRVEFLRNFLEWHARLSTFAAKEYHAYFAPPGKWHPFFDGLLRTTDQSGG